MTTSPMMTRGTATHNEHQAAYDDHQAWLRTLHSAHEQYLTRQASAAQLPAVPMAWLQSEEVGVNEEVFASDFAGIELDDECYFDEQPVYRSLGGLFASGSAPTGGPEIDFDQDEVPVYRGCSFRSQEEEEESNWLQTMPPLLARQNARANLLELA